MNTLLVILILFGACIICWQAPAVVRIKRELSGPISCDRKEVLQQELRDRILILVLVAFIFGLFYQHNAA